MIHQLLPFPRNFKIFLLSEVMKKIIYGKRNFKYVICLLIVYLPIRGMIHLVKYIYNFITTFEEILNIFSLIFFSLVRSFNFCHTSFPISFTLTEKHHAENRIFAP